jgi:hypothetical protein
MANPLSHSSFGLAYPPDSSPLQSPSPSGPQTIPKARSPLNRNGIEIVVQLA